MRAPIDTIPAPEFLPRLRWLNIDGRRLRMSALRGRPVLIEFFDFCRPNSIRTLPYTKAWHERYGSHEAGLQVIGIHSPGFPPGRDDAAVAEAMARLGVTHPVLLDGELAMWRVYENLGWPARYLFDQEGVLYDYHYGEGAYRETELAIQELLARDGSAGAGGGEGEGPAAAPAPPPLDPIRPEDAPDATLARQSDDREGPYSGPYEAGGVWVVLEGSGTLTVNGGQPPDGLSMQVTHPGAYPVVEHDRHVRGQLQLQTGDGLRCLATCFTPGLVS